MNVMICFIGQGFSMKDNECLGFGSLFLVVGYWFFVLGSRFLVLGSWFLLCPLIEYVDRLDQTFWLGSGTFL
jgi:hypothetical protein